MLPPALPPRDRLSICFAHVAYQMQARFDARGTGLRCFQVRSREELAARIAEADVLSVSMMWSNELIARAPRLRLIQSISAGVDQYDRAALAQAGIRLASAAGVNANAVAEHAMALILSLSRRLPEARDNQARRVWRGMISDPAQREAELAGRTLLIVGLGRIGSRLARLAKAFDMRVLATRRDPAAGAGAADAVGGMEALGTMLPEADYVALACPLTPQTERLINAETLALMRPGAALVNVARGRCVDEPQLVAALGEGRIAAAALDCAAEEPLAESSPLWAMPNVLVTPHTAGETRAYEDNVIDILLDNIGRLWRAEAGLRNQVV
ncbi:MAG: D-2-hydroxyacid dehydrogenase [Acetobacteraceae bacterium]|nr:D-2-hydroxyacid dehydrogenase [Acetobacteraceae bacterium]